MKGESEHEAAIQQVILSSLHRVQGLGASPAAVTMECPQCHEHMAALADTLLPAKMLEHEARFCPGAWTGKVF